MNIKYNLVNITALLFAASLFSACSNAKDETTQSGTEKANAKEDVVLQDSVWMTRGAEVIGKTFATLSGRLKSALQEKGVQGAVSYCNLNAYPLIDSLSKAYGAQIRRTSLKLRNPKDAPDEYELIALQKAQSIASKGEKINPWVEHLPQGKVAYYAPIYLMPQCLQCHGTPGETMSEDDYKLIKEHYPEDQAIGYQAGDWRGLWSIRFEN